MVPGAIEPGTAPGAIDPGVIPRPPSMWKRPPFAGMVASIIVSTAAANAARAFAALSAVSRPSATAASMCFTLAA